MANSSHHKSARNHIHTHLRFSEPLLRAKGVTSHAESRRVSKESIARLKHMIAVQEDQVKKMRHRSMGSRSQTLRVRAFMKDLLVVTRLTLQQIRQSTDNLEL